MPLVLFNKVNIYKYEEMLSILMQKSMIINNM